MCSLLAALVLANLAAVGAQLSVARLLGLRRAGWRLGFRRRGAPAERLGVGIAPLFVLPELVDADARLPSRGRSALLTLAAPLGVWLGAAALFLPTIGPMAVAREARLSAVAAGSPAATVGLQPGDVVTAFTGAPVEDWDGLRSQLQANPGGTVSLAFQRGGQARSVTVALARGARLGVTPTLVRQTFGARLLAAARSTWTVPAAALTTIAEVLREPRLRPEGGPVGLYDAGAGAGAVVTAFALPAAMWMSFVAYGVALVAVVALGVGTSQAR